MAQTFEYVRQNVSSLETSDSETMTADEAARINKALQAQSAPYRWVRHEFLTNRDPRGILAPMRASARRAKKVIK